MRTPQLRENATDDDTGIAGSFGPSGVRTVAHGGTALAVSVTARTGSERDLAFAILTNHTDGWRLIQRAERSALELCEGCRSRRTRASAIAA
jgi:hypothetical protein